MSDTKQEIKHFYKTRETFLSLVVAIMLIFILFDECPSIADSIRVKAAVWAGLEPNMRQCDK